MTIFLDSRRVLWWMAGAICCLVAAHIGIQALAFHLVDTDFLGIEEFFDLDAEANLPTFYEALAMLLAAAILLSIARLEQADPGSYRYWSGLAIVFVALAIDEAAAVHEIVSNVWDMFFVTSGFFYYSWVIPYAAALIVLFLLYARFLFRLPARVRALILAAGAIFALGALGLEAVSARHDQLSGGDYDLTATILAIAEEALEMTGIALFIYALLAYVEQRHGGLEIAIGNAVEIKKDAPFSPMRKEVRRREKGTFEKKRVAC